MRQVRERVKVGGDGDAAMWLERLTDLDLVSHASMLTTIVALDVGSLAFFPSSHAACALIAVWGPPIAPVALRLAGVDVASLTPLLFVYRDYALNWPLARTVGCVAHMHARYVSRLVDIATDDHAEATRAYAAALALAGAGIAAKTVPPAPAGPRRGRRRGRLMRSSYCLRQSTRPERWNSSRKPWAHAQTHGTRRFLVCQTIYRASISTQSLLCHNRRRLRALCPSRRHKPQSLHSFVRFRPSFRKCLFGMSTKSRWRSQVWRARGELGYGDKISLAFEGRVSIRG
jgi:hypothetical protein